MKPVYLTHYKRTAFSRAHPKKTEVDPFAGERGDLLLAKLIDNALAETGLAPSAPDDLSIGCALSVKDQWSFGGRYPLFQSRLGDQCASRSIDQQCGSGIAALRSEFMNIASGAADLSLAGGYENMTRIPMGPALFQQGILTVPELPESIQSLKQYQMAVAMNMGLTAEALAESNTIGREEMDLFAEQSHQKAARAQTEGFLDGEILPVETHQGVYSKDACIRPDTRADRLAELNPVFTEAGQITAGNSSPLTSGAAVSLLASEEAVTAHNLTPSARILAVADRGVRPETMGEGVVPAVERLLLMTGLTADQIDFWEINEAFSVVPLYAIRTLGIDPERVNIKGGALALGHPLGATGIRITGTLSRVLTEQKGRYGIAAACIGGGQGIAILIERI